MKEFPERRLSGVDTDVENRAHESAIRKLDSDQEFMSQILGAKDPLEVRELVLKKINLPTELHTSAPQPLGFEEKALLTEAVERWNQKRIEKTS